MPTKTKKTGTARKATKAKAKKLTKDKKTTTAKKNTKAKKAFGKAKAKKVKTFKAFTPAFKKAA